MIYGAYNNIIFISKIFRVIFLNLAKISRKFPNSKIFDQIGIKEFNNNNLRQKKRTITKKFKKIILEKLV